MKANKKTRKNKAKKMPRRKIFWTGIGSNLDGLHTKDEFLQIMYAQYPHTLYSRRRGDTVMPNDKIKKGDIDAWMEFAGAKYT